MPYHHTDPPALEPEGERKDPLKKDEQITQDEQTTKEKQGQLIEEFEREFAIHMPDNDLRAISEIRSIPDLHPSSGLTSTCTQSDMMAVAMQYVYPLYVYPYPQYVNQQQFFVWWLNMWDHWDCAGQPNTNNCWCNWWANRVNHWTSQLPTLVNPFHIQLKTAKILFAQGMHVACNCPGPVPAAPVSSSLPASFDSGLNSTFDAFDCRNVAVYDTNATRLVLVNPVLNTSISIYHSLFVAGSSFSTEIAKRGNKIYIHGVVYYPSTGNYTWSIREFKIGPPVSPVYACSLTHVRDVPLPQTGFGGSSNAGAGLCATIQYDAAASGPGSQVLTAGSITFGDTWLQANGYWTGSNPGAQLAKIEVPATNTPPETLAYVAPIHSFQGNLGGDIVYIPSNNTHVVAENLAGIWMAVHYDSIGTVLGQALIPGNVGSFAMFSYQDDVFVSTHNNDIYHMDIINYTMALSTLDISPYGSMGDAASDPECSLVLPCNLTDMMDAAVATVSPVYSAGPGGGGAYAFSAFVDNMWNHYTGASPGPTGCDWWINRWNHWISQMPYYFPTPSPAITNLYQLALKQAKINFAWLMIAACDCDEPMITQNNTENEMINHYLARSANVDGTIDINNFEINIKNISRSKATELIAAIQKQEKTDNVYLLYKSLIAARSKAKY